MAVGEPALVDEIRRQAAAEIEAAWQEARDQVETFRAEHERAVEDARARARQRVAQAAAAAELHATAEAEAAARRIEAAALRALADRVQAVAFDLLGRFRDDEYAALFAALVRDLPERPWHRVIVSPQDGALAASHFPDAEVVCDPAIESGLVVETEDGCVRVDNTLRTRLETAWPELLPAIVRSIRDAL